MFVGIPKSNRRVVLASSIAGLVLVIVLVAVVLRLAYDVVTGPRASGDAWAFLAAVVAAGATVTGVLVTWAQDGRTQQRLQLDTAISGLQLLTDSNGRYAPQGVVAGAIATLVHLQHPVIAMRVLAPCWERRAVDASSATWLISEIFASDAESACRAQHEAASMLDMHATELCRRPAGSFAWPSSIEFEWIPHAPFPARLRVLRAVLRTLLSREPGWWHEGGRLGWGVLLLHQAMQQDPHPSIRVHAKDALATLLEVTEHYELVELLSADDWTSIDEVKRNMQELGETISDPRHEQRRIVMLVAYLDQLKAWATQVEPIETGGDLGDS